MGLGSRFKNWFYFSRASRSVILLLCGILLGIGGCVIYLQHQKEEMFPSQPAIAEGSAIPSPKGQTDLPKDIPTTSVNPQEKQTSYSLPSPSAEQFYFDPNTADSITLHRLGLNRRIIRNIYKYRAHGGVFHRAEDFARLYGLTKGDFDRLYPYIRIADRFKLMKDLPPVKKPHRPLYAQVEKYPAGTQIALNTADTADLKKIPGIGSYYAKEIIEYREKLGGFHSTKQLREIKGLPADIAKWFTVPTDSVRKLALNRLSFDALYRHPYLNYYQCKVIMEHRRKYGPIKDLDELSLYREFTPSDLERLSPYLSFEK